MAERAHCPPLPRTSGGCGGAKILAALGQEHLTFAVVWAAYKEKVTLHRRNVTPLKNKQRNNTMKEL